MRTFSILAALGAVTMLFGCASSAAPATSATTPLAFEPAVLDTEAALSEAPMEEETLAASSFDLSGLPAAPWAEARLASNEVPAPILTAWARAENRTQCAPIAPASFGAADGARARLSSLVEGGWAVEFDRRGMPGMAANGDSCARCGRGVFGIAGTSMSPDELVGEEDEADAPTPSFADGSHLSVEPPAEGESVAAATLTVGGQGCVYQVWSFLGEAHVRELVAGLRLVEVRETAQVAAR